MLICSHDFLPCQSGSLGDLLVGHGFKFLDQLFQRRKTRKIGDVVENLRRSIAAMNLASPAISTRHAAAQIRAPRPASSRRPFLPLRIGDGPRVALCPARRKISA